MFSEQWSICKEIVLPFESLMWIPLRKFQPIIFSKSSNKSWNPFSVDKSYPKKIMKTILTDKPY